MAHKQIVCILSDETIHAVAFEEMGRRVEMLAKAQHPFRLSDSLFAEHDANAIAAVIAGVCNQVGLGSEDIHLVLPLNWCFTQSLAINAKRLNDEALGYEFEPYLPVPLEQLTCAYLRLNDDRVLAVAVPTEPMQAILGALGERGLEIVHLGVDVFAASQSEIGRRIVISDSRWTRILEHDGGETRILPTVKSSEWMCDPLLSPGIDGSNGGLDVIFRLMDSSSDDFAANGACDPTTPEFRKLDEAVDGIARGAITLARSFDLRCGALGGVGPRDALFRSLNHCVACMIVLLFILIAGMRFQMHFIAIALDVVDHARAKVYGEVFQTSTLPPGAAVRVASERIRLQGLTHTPRQSTAKSTPNMPPALDLMREVATKMPSDVRVMLAEARVDETLVSLRGQTVEHSDAERIVQAIRGVPGLEVRPPRTNRLQSGEVQFSITAGPIHEK